MKTTIRLTRHFAAIAFVMFAGIASAQQRPSYGGQITLEDAKKIAAAAVVEAKKNNWNVAIAIVDNHGMLIYYEMLDDTQTSSATITIEKARTAAMFRRPSKAFEDVVSKGRVAVLGLPGVTPVQGGLPIYVNGKIIGGVGASGVNSDQDEQVVQAGLNALK
jgi:uncharacterized protein GlcG (DUF336 family)